MITLLTTAWLFFMCMAFTAGLICTGIAIVMRSMAIGFIAVEALLLLGIILIIL